MLRFRFMAPSPSLAVWLGVCAMWPQPAAAVEPANDASSATLETITVIAQHLNEARASIQTQTGASTYVINEEEAHVVRRIFRLFLKFGFMF